jgi:hypothetical protein
MIINHDSLVLRSQKHEKQSFWDPSIPISMTIKITYPMYDDILHNTLVQYEIH